jgi:16S rRNA processing protein RimM
LNKPSWDDWILVGKVARPHGLAGALRAWIYSGSGDCLMEAEAVCLRGGSGAADRYRVQSVRPLKKAFLLKLEGLDTIEEAEKYRNAEILVDKEALYASREQGDEYFWFELLGVKVYVEDGSFIGIIENIMPTGSNDIYVVRGGDREILIPAIHDVVKEIDPSTKKMIIYDVEGLLELNAV